MSNPRNWTEEQLLVAFSLYCRLSFGQFHQRNPEIIQYAALIGRTPDALAMKLANIASLDPVITESGRHGLQGASKADRKMWDEMQLDWAGFALRSQAALAALGTTTTEPIEPANYTGKERLIESKQRIGQDLFRQSVLSAYDYRCCISGLAVPELLIASHIVPWRVDEKNRLNPKNGLALSALHDKAFDLGYLSLDESYQVIISPLLKNEKDHFLQDSLWKFHGKKISMPKKFSPLKESLEYHRQNIYQEP